MMCTYVGADSIQGGVVKHIRKILSTNIERRVPESKTAAEKFQQLNSEIENAAATYSWMLKPSNTGGDRPK